MTYNLKDIIMIIGLQFIISAGIIVFAGIRLTRHADILSDRLNLGKIWIGIILLGMVTSLPEAVTSLTAVISLKAGDLAVGNILGSNNFNIFLIVIMDMLYRQGSVTNHLPFNRERFLPALFAVIFSGIVASEIFLSGFLRLPQFLGMSFGSLMIILLYFTAIQMCFSNGQGGILKDLDLPSQVGSQPMSHIYFNLTLSTVLVAGASIWLTNVADTIALTTGLGRTFVGTLFLAGATSLPEMVVTISALKLSALDLALGNIFGSNMINIFILSLCDIFYGPRALLSSVSKTHLLTALAGIVMSVVVWFGIRDCRKRTFLGLGWDSILLTVSFIAGLSMVYFFK